MGVVMPAPAAAEAGQPERKRKADETPEERAARKEAKRARKAEKEAKKEAKRAKTEGGAAAAPETPERAPAPAAKTAAAAPLQAIKDFLTKHEIRVHSSAAPPPCLKLAEAPFPPKLVSKLCAQGFTEPSAVQAASWPLAVKGRDLLAIAKTGSGKTLGFLLPALSLVAAEGARVREPVAVVMAPTRELALQIHAEAVKFGGAVGARAVCLYGGSPKGPQARELRMGAGLVVATPGRLLDFLDLHGQSGYGPQVSVAKCKMLVLDEADRMLDMGFEKDIMALAEAIPKGRQTLLYTATWPKAVQRVAASLLDAQNMVKVTVGSGGDKLTANKSVTQHVTVCQPNEKWERFLEMIKPLAPGGELAEERTIIFCNTKRDTQGVGDHLWQEGYKVEVIHGDRSQQEREYAVRQFKAGKVLTLVCTDVAARGLDITGVKAVFNMDFPRDSAEDYIHRIGRTGRAGATGEAHTLFTAKDVRHGRELVRILSDANQEVPAELERMVQRNGARKAGGGRGGYGRGGGGGRGGRAFGGRQRKW